MHEKVIEILVYLVNEMRNNKTLAEIDLRVLEEGGFTQNEITNAFNWLLEKLAASGQLPAQVEGYTDRSHRILHNVEKLVISVEAQGYLIQLRELGILNDAMVEAVIDRAMMSGYAKIGLEETKAIVSSLVIEKEEPKRIEHRYHSQSTDTIH